MGEPKWKPMQSVPNNGFDVLVIYWDAGLDQFLCTRFAGCVKVDDRILWATPSPNSRGAVDLVEAGYRPVRWAHIPKMPSDIDSILKSTRETQ